MMIGGTIRWFERRVPNRRNERWWSTVIKLEWLSVGLVDSPCSFDTSNFAGMNASRIDQIKQKTGAYVYINGETTDHKRAVRIRCCCCFFVERRFRFSSLGDYERHSWTSQSSLYLHRKSHSETQGWPSTPETTTFIWQAKTQITAHCSSMDLVIFVFPLGLVGNSFFSRDIRVSIWSINTSSPVPMKKRSSSSYFVSTLSVTFILLAFTHVHHASDVCFISKLIR